MTVHTSLILIVAGMIIRVCTKGRLGRQIDRISVALYNVDK